MFKWFFVTERDGDVFEEFIDVNNSDDAKKIALTKWQKMSKHDQDKTKEAFIVCAISDANNVINYDSAVYMCSIK